MSLSYSHQILDRAVSEVSHDGHLLTALNLAETSWSTHTHSFSLKQWGKNSWTTSQMRGKNSYLYPAGNGLFPDWSFVAGGVVEQCWIGLQTFPPLSPKIKRHHLPSLPGAWLSMRFLGDGQYTFALKTSYLTILLICFWWMSGIAT